MTNKESDDCGSLEELLSTPGELDWHWVSLGTAPREGEAVSMLGEVTVTDGETTAGVLRLAENKTSTDGEVVDVAAPVGENDLEGGL